jgi:hypothetical protein
MASTDKKLIKARREVERLRLEAGGATETDIEIWRAECRVRDLERAERQAAAAGARRAALGMDLALFVVAALVMAFSLGNIRQFAMDHGIEDPIAAFIAPAIDLALVAALVGDAVLSRVGLDAGPWATRLRYVSGVLTLVLNSWEAAAAMDFAGLLLHGGMPVLLFVLAEAASPYRRTFAESVRLAGQDTMSTPEPEPVSTPADTVPEPEPAEADEPEPAPAVSTMTPQVAERTPIRAVPDPEPVSTPAAEEASTPGTRLDAAAAKAAIESAWEAGLTVREAATRATRATSYVGTVYARLARERGPQPVKGQTRIEGDAA